MVRRLLRASFSLFLQMTLVSRILHSSVLVGFRSLRLLTTSNLFLANLSMHSLIRWLNLSCSLAVVDLLRLATLNLASRKVLRVWLVRLKFVLSKVCRLSKFLMNLLLNLLLQRLLPMQLVQITIH